MDNDQHNSFAVGITSRDAGYATQEKPKQEEQKQSKKDEGQEKTKNKQDK